MPASIKVVSVFAVALAATASGYFLLVPADPLQDPTDDPASVNVDLQGPAPERTGTQQRTDRLSSGDQSRGRERQVSESKGLIADSVRQATSDSPPSDPIESAVDIEHGPLWERMAQADSSTFTSAKADVDLPPQPDEFVGPPLIESDSLAIAEGTDLAVPLVPHAETESSDPVVDVPTDTPTETMESVPRRVVAPQIHVVKQGDTYQSISQEWFGDESMWGLVAEANPTIDSRRMQVGQRIVLPPMNTSARSNSGREIDRTNTYVIRAGDTLTRIATRLWGDPAKWRELYHANRSTIGTSPDTLQVGMKLTVPRPGQP